LSESWRSGDRCGESRENKDSTDAIKAHGIISPMCVMGGLSTYNVFKICCVAAIPNVP
jgi:hypothetical protein